MGRAAIPSVIKVVPREPLAVTDTFVAMVAVKAGAVPSKMEATKVVGTTLVRALVGTGAALVADTAIGPWPLVVFATELKAVVTGNLLGGCSGAQLCRLLGRKKTK